MLGGETRNSLEIFVGKPVGKRPLGRSRRREDNDTKIGYVRNGRNA
jgi:hypothetical protein